MTATATASNLRGLWLLLAAAALVVVAALSVAIGTRDVGLNDIVSALSGRVGTIGEAAVAMRIPRPRERAAFQSLGQSMQGLSMGVSSIATSYLIASAPDGRLIGVPRLAIGVMTFVWLFPLLLFRLERMMGGGDGGDPLGALPEPETA